MAGALNFRNGVDNAQFRRVDRWLANQDGHDDLGRQLVDESSPEVVALLRSANNQSFQPETVFTK